MTIAKPAGGVLPISAAQIQPNGSNAKATTSQSRPKVIVRRLAPGLTQQELQEALGEEWAVGKGKVDWMQFRPGKVSKDLSKPSRPARVYFQITSQAHLETLAEKVRTTTFTDARNTAGDTVLIGPPTLEFAPYGRVPANKKRHDARQGLIDQDPEFIQFLESLTNPITKPVATELSSETLDRKDATTTVTPLIQHLREKKAAKEAAKEKSSAAKAAKHTRQGSKNENAETKAETEASAPVVKDTPKIPEKKQGRTAKAEKGVKTASRPAKTENAAIESKTQITPRGSPQIAKAVPEVTKSAPESTTKKSDTINPGAAAARMLQRDLGLRGGRGGSARRAGNRQGTEQTKAIATTPNAPVQASSSDKTNATPVAPKSTAPTTTTPSTKTDALPQATTVNKPPTAPAIMKRTASSRPAPPTTAKPNPKPTIPPVAAPTPVTNASACPINAVNPPTAPSSSQPLNLIPPTQPTQHKAILSNSTSTRAFLKHANPSQGITEPLLLTALSAFGPVTTVEIDKRKGFAYVEFADPEGLKKAIAGSPVKVAQGSVQVLERKDRVSSTPAVQRNVVNTAPIVAPIAAAVTGVAGGAGVGVGVGRGTPAVRGGPVPGRGGPGAASQHTQQSIQQQGFRGGRGGAARGRGGAARGSNVSAIPTSSTATGITTSELAATSTSTPMPGSIVTATLASNESAMQATDQTPAPAPVAEASVPVSVDVPPPAVPAVAGPAPAIVSDQPAKNSTEISGVEAKTE